MTCWFATGLPAASVSATTSGAATVAPIVPDWLLPESSLICACVGARRVTMMCVSAELPTRSMARARIVFGPSASGTAGARNVRLETCATNSLALTSSFTCACWSFTVPTTMSLTLPAIEIDASVVTN